MKIALIAFDGLDPRIVYDNIDDLPNFKSLIDESMHGRWRTPGHTIPSFTATLTGQQYNNCNFHWDEGKGDYQRHRQTGHDYLWDVTDSSISLINIPVLYPPEEIDDAMVCGFLTPDDVADSNLARPVEFQEYLNEINYIHDVHADRTYEELGEQGMLDHLEHMMIKRCEAAERMIALYDSDLFYGVWTATDRWFHQCHLHDVDFMPLYKYADKVLERMMKSIPDNIPLIVFSDHGFAHLRRDDGVHKGHMYEGWYSVRAESLPNYRNDSASIYDLFPTVVNYLEGEVPTITKGRMLFHQEKQDNQVEERLRDLGYLE